MSGRRRKYSHFRIMRFRLQQFFNWQLHTSCRPPVSWALVIAGLLLLKAGSHKRGLTWILKGRRVAPVRRAEVAIKDVLERGEGGTWRAISGCALGTSSARSVAGRLLIVKVPAVRDGRVIERGALMLKFSETFVPVLDCVDERLLTKYFRVILEPSWVGYSLPEILAWSTVAPEKVVVLAPYKDDHEFLSRLGANLIPCALGPADWVNPNTFRPLKDVRKVYDCIYVANYKPSKRVDRYVRAVVRISQERPGFRAALVCAGFGSARDHIEDLLAWADSRARISVFRDIDQVELNRLFCQSKVNVLVSLREGANKGLAEGMFSGTPALLLAECACGNFRHITLATGKVVPDADLESGLKWFSDHYRDLDPRAWAERHIAPKESARRLSRVLRELELSEGGAWSRDIMPKTNEPELAYLEEKDQWLLREREGLLAVFARNSKQHAVDGWMSRIQR